MSKAMNIVVAYDGSECADIALQELRYAGIPDGTTVTVISVSEWFPALPVEGSELLAQRPMETRDNALELSEAAAERMKGGHPTWTFRCEGLAGSAAHEIVRRAEELGADLIVVGSHGRSAIGRFMLGSVSHQILTASCGANVHIARKGYRPEEAGPLNIGLAIDGSDYSESVIDAVLERSWPADTNFVVISAAEYSYDRAEEEEGMERLRQLHSTVSNRLSERGFSTRSVIDTHMTHPKRVILSEAEQSNISCLFMGARGLTGFERFVLGSISTAVAMQAECSVEIIYHQEK